MNLMDIKISVIGLGYVGLPVAVAFSKKKFEVIGFDINQHRIKKLQEYNDDTGEVSKRDLKNSKIYFTSDYKNLSKANFHIITVPTPIDEYKNPDLSLIIKALYFIK